MRVLFSTLLMFFVCSHVFAHKPSDAYLTLNAGAQGLSGHWDIAVVDLDAALALDDNHNGEVTWGEVKQKRDALLAYAAKSLTVSQGSTACALQLNPPTTIDHSDGTYLRFVFNAGCNMYADKVLAIDYAMMRGVDPHHRGIAALNVFGSTSTRVLNNQATATPTSGAFSAFVDFVREGIVHISIGLDHVLFIVLMVAAAVRPFALWPRKALWPLAAMVTAFTVAHSLTLGLALFEWVNVSSRWIEPAIAATVLICAIDVVRPFLLGPRWLYAFAFGLLHGLGLASALTALKLASEDRLLALLGFNVGVEIGQLVIALVAYAVLRSVVAAKINVATVSRFAALPVAFIALIWLGERLSDSKWIPF